MSTNAETSLADPSPNTKLVWSMVSGTELAKEVEAPVQKPSAMLATSLSSSTPVATELGIKCTAAMLQKTSMAWLGVSGHQGSAWGSISSQIELAIIQSPPFGIFSLVIPILVRCLVSCCGMIGNCV